jgi:sulfur-carrier protein
VSTAGTQGAAAGANAVRVALPVHLRTLAGVDGDVRLTVDGAVTPRAVLDALERRFPVLRGTIRDHATLQRRSFVRFYAGTRDVSHDPVDDPLPAAVARGREPFRIVGALAGG